MSEPGERACILVVFVSARAREREKERLDSERAPCDRLERVKMELLDAPGPREYHGSSGAAPFLRRFQRRPPASSFPVRVRVVAAPL